MYRVVKSSTVQRSRDKINSKEEEEMFYNTSSYDSTMEELAHFNQLEGGDTPVDFGTHPRTVKVQYLVPPVN